METLKLKAIIQDGSIYNLIVHKPDGMLYHRQTNAMMGRNVSALVEYLKNPANDDVLRRLMVEVESHWNV
jgi:hypothetical protein